MYTITKTIKSTTFRTEAVGVGVCCVGVLVGVIDNVGVTEGVIVGVGVFVSVVVGVKQV